jgi:hypothetical protein
MPIDTCVENFSGAVLHALEVSSTKCRPPLPIPAGIQEEMRLKNRLRRRWQVTRDPALKAEVNRLQWSVTRLLKEWRNDQWSATLESLDPEDQLLWRTTKRVMRVPTPSPLVTPGGNALSASEKAEALADNSETQLQPVTDPSVPAVIETANVGLRSNLMAPASEPKLTNLEVQDAIRVLRVGKAPGPNGIPNRVLKHSERYPS